MRFRAVALLATTIGVGLSGIAAAQHATPFDLQDGARAYGDSCANCHGPDGNLIEGIDFGRGVYRRTLSDDEIVGIILRGIPETPMPATPGMSEEQARRIVAHLRAWALEGRVAVEGDPEQGREIFFGKGACDDCHAVNGRGARHGPDLSSIGRELRAVELEAALVDPNAIVRPTARSYRVELANGETVTGRLLNHDTFTVQLIDTDDRLRSFVKAELSGHGFVESPMPAYGGRLTPGEITDLVSFMASLVGETDE